MFLLVPGHPGSPGSRAVKRLLLLYEISQETAEWMYAKFTQKTCLVPRSDEFECQRSRSQGQKRNFLALWRFMFGKTCLASSFNISFLVRMLISFNLHINVEDLRKILQFRCQYRASIFAKFLSFRVIVAVSPLVCTEFSAV